MYYSKNEYRLVKYQKSTRKGKMYDAILKKKETGREVKVSFGDNTAQNFHDKTGLNLYPHLIHGDKKRRENYKSRAGGRVKEGYYSPSYFSYYVLW